MIPHNPVRGFGALQGFLLRPLNHRLELAYDLVGSPLLQLVFDRVARHSGFHKVSFRNSGHLWPLYYTLTVKIIWSSTPLCQVTGLFDQPEGFRDKNV